MTLEVLEKLKHTYDKATERARAVIGVFEHQFGDSLVDNTLISFDHFLQKVSIITPSDLCVFSQSGSNNFGSYYIAGSPNDIMNILDTPICNYNADPNIIDFMYKELSGIITKEVGMFSPDGKQTFYIIIKFPEVTVKNENNNSVKIYDLFVKVPVTLNGLSGGGFTMLRTTYPIEQWVSDYCHSHVSGTPLEFRAPCLGTGPIKRTINTLRLNYDVNIWGLYAYELSKYVTVESLSGTPYRRLENISIGGGSPINTDDFYCTSVLHVYGYPIDQIEAFIKHFLKTEHLKFTYRNGGFVLGESVLDVWIRMSNLFIRLQNQSYYDKRYIEGGYKSKHQLKREGIIRPYTMINGKLYYYDESCRQEGCSLEGKTLLIFKGEAQQFHIIEQSQEVPKICLIPSNWVMFAINKALKIINYRYGRERSERKDSEPQAGSRVLYF